MEVKYIANQDIDIKKWDNCIHRSVNGIVYAYSWYLQIVNPNWDALVLNDYEAVMPLTWKKKLGVPYLYQPFFTQQGGVFSPHRLTPELVNTFIEKIPPHFKYVTINLNTFNRCDLSEPDISDRLTYELDLIEPYEKLARKFSTNTIRNIKHANQKNIKVVQGLAVKDLVDFKRKNQLVSIGYGNYNRLKQIMAFSLANGSGRIYGAYSENNQLCATAFFIGSHNKVIYLVSSSNQEGKQNRAMFLIIDQFIREHAGNHLTLDFEGSMIPSVARFFQGFGSTPCYYQHIHLNRLPWWVKLLKKYRK